MKVLLQRVSRAKVEVAEQTVGAIEQGLLLFIAIEQHDTLEQLSRMAQKILNYRVFSDGQGKMNLSVRDIKGGDLAISQFTLAAETTKGLRPSFSKGAHPDDAKRLYEQFLQILRTEHTPIEQGIFAADMQVSLTNDGPVTFMLQL